MEKVLILGASGLVGRALINELNDRFDVYGTYSSTQPSLPENRQFQLEIQEIESLQGIIQSIKPDIVISCLRGEFIQQLKFHKELAMELRKMDSRMYYFSTTNVFDGDLSKPHSETDTPISESDYGKFKLECEKMLTEILDERLVIVRIPAIWGKDSPRWHEINESIKNNKEITVYSNLVCNNHLDIVLAKQIRYIIENELKGIFHLGSTDLMTQAQFYEQILSKLEYEGNLLRYTVYQEPKDTGYFTLKSIRNDLPESLQYTNEDIISYLLEESNIKVKEK
ncbi:sugar nucleotide-binding protein [Fictibacillus barbaricus]|uniref:dTDP-4-dehydrorhamnose reductase n=1 Tax=Fictibacillus barbaricus TaxID=182136 RepID=A0ABU1TWM0_9BACL|nr:sugar nucleotide-binding protein [Fictibacillus barbaricus]MDR7071610.1 dTDP-4-dehydrorhamnose reductase [Fictibacillus barbaricus]